MYRNIIFKVFSIQLQLSNSFWRNLNFTGKEQMHDLITLDSLVYETLAYSECHFEIYTHI